MSEAWRPSIVSSLYQASVEASVFRTKYTEKERFLAFFEQVEGRSIPQNESTAPLEFLGMASPTAKGAGLEGKAVIRRYTNADLSPHFSVEVQPSIGTRIETHQTRSASRKSTYVNEVDDLIREHLGHAEVREVPLANAFKAQGKQLQQLGAGDMGPWRARGPSANSCTTPICEVILAGGGDAPASAAGAQQYLYDLFGINTKGGPK